MLKIRSDIILEGELLIKQHRFSSCVKQLDHDEITLALIKMIFFVQFLLIQFHWTQKDF